MDQKEPTVDDLRREQEAQRALLEEHGRGIRANTEAIKEVKDHQQEHGGKVDRLEGKVEQGFKGIDGKLDIVIDFYGKKGIAARSFDIIEGLIGKMDGKTIMIVAAIMAGAYLIGQGGASVIKAQGYGMSVDVQSSETVTP